MIVLNSILIFTHLEFYLITSILKFNYNWNLKNMKKYNVIYQYTLPFKNLKVTTQIYIKSSKFVCIDIKLKIKQNSILFIKRVMMGYYSPGSSKWVTAIPCVEDTKLFIWQLINKNKSCDILFTLHNMNVASDVNWRNQKSIQQYCRLLLK